MITLSEPGTVLAHRQHCSEASGKDCKEGDDQE